MKATAIKPEQVLDNKQSHACIVRGCSNTFTAPYGRWGTGGTCSKNCEEKQKQIQHDRPRHCSRPVLV